MELIPINEASQKNIFHDVVERVHLLLDKIRNYIAGKVQTTLNHYKNIEAQIRKVVKKAIDAFKPRLQLVINEAKQKLQELFKEVKNDFSYCLSTAEIHLKEIFKNFLIRQDYCVGKEFYGSVSNIIETVKNVFGAIQNVEIHAKELKNCVKGDVDVDCVKTNIWDPVKMQGKTMKLFVREATNGTDIVSGLQINLATCAATQISTAADETADIVRRFPECLINKFVNQ